MRKYVFILISIVVTAIVLSGCGETFNGIGKDFRRISKGTRTILVRDE